MREKPSVFCFVFCCILVYLLSCICAKEMHNLTWSYETTDSLRLHFEQVQFSNTVSVSHWELVEVACSLTREEILQDWEWLHSNLMTTLTSFDTEEEITEFVCCKIQSIIANSIPDSQFADGRITNCYLNRRGDRSMHKLSVDVVYRRRPRVF